MLKKHSIALVLGAMIAAPAAFADDTATQGIIYQADQTGAVANINQVQADGLPQAAAILQIDSSGTGNADVANIATVIQGAAAGAAGQVTVDSTGAAFNSDTTDAVAGLAGVTDFTGPTVPDLSAYTDQNTGAAPFQVNVVGGSQNNYGLIVQDGQQKSQAIVIQATGLEVDNAIAAQNSLTNGDIAANGDTDTASATAGGAFTLTVQDYNSQAVGQGEVVVNFADGTYSIDLGNGEIALTDLSNYVEPDNAEGNLAVITQGTHLTFSTINGVDIDVDDSFAGSDVTNNQALALQNGTNGYVGIGQQGSFNTALALQNGDSNFIETFQYEGDSGSPLNEFALVAQVGNNNIAQTYQAGAVNSSYVFQIGDGNVAQVDQSTDVAGASGAIAFVYQSNAAAGADFVTGNYASVYQHLAP
ncbi:hypothetical protein SAMN04488038_10485 [Solimonas aquatica]|uniref:Curlin associated repeat-containing protein n=1 Tax=Solimonas aquatica TaxID=489703 RepID=A0A1H9DLQ0_9GAMM|nr:hypothetical protein [Solimonas aquatica]SEQ14349.1 hypothetical protein SAMN04488038_10485 [Solimonas aquatica]